MANLKIKLVKSLNGRLDKHIATAKSLGLNKIGDSIVHADDAVLAGKIKVISHLVAVETVEA